MPETAVELEAVLMRMIAEHRALLECVEAHQSAMKSMNLPRMREAALRQESVRQRIAGLDQRRQLLTVQRSRELRVGGPLTLAALAAADPLRGRVLLKLRDELKRLVEQVAARTHIASRLAAAVLGHLNTAVRLLGGAMQQAGVYTRSGPPRVAGRIGIMEAVG